MENTMQLYYLISVSFIVYFIISYAYKILKIQNIEGALLTSKGLLLINIKHVLGVLLFGILFYLLNPEYRFLILTVEIPSLITILLFVVVVFISALLAHNSVKNPLKNRSELSKSTFKHGW